MKKYPGRKQKNRNKSRLGKHLEMLIDKTNFQYRQLGVAWVNKIPPPVDIIHRRNTRGPGSRDAKARLRKGYLVDYIGVYKGRGVAFEAKSTKSKTSFPLSNIVDHQYQFLKNWKKNGGISFIIVEFYEYKEYYVLSQEQLEEWWFGAYTLGDRNKSIKIEWFRENCHALSSSDGIILDYAEYLEQVM